MLPVMLNVSGKKCVIIGGGNAAWRKAKTLAENGADVTVVSREISEKLNGLPVTLVKKEYSPDDINGCFIAVAATDSAELNSRIRSDAKSRARLFMSADGAKSDLAFTAYTRSGDVTIAASTGGKYPLLSTKICEKLNGLCESYAKKADALENYRERVLKSGLDKEEKRQLLDALVTDEMLESDIEQFREKAEEILRKKI